MLADLSPDQLRLVLRDGRIAIETGPLKVRIKTRLPDVARYLGVLYAQHPALIDPDFADLHVEVRTPRNLRRWLRKQVEFVIDGDTPFEPLPREQAPAILEWGMNWSIAASCHQWLTIHAACLSRDGAAVVLPAPPGSGKSTLCAALALRGWRLLSDELTLVDTTNLGIHALARPINLKNASIDLIHRFEPTAVWGPETYDTNKGRVAHLRPPAGSVVRMLDPAQPRWIVFPRYLAGAEPQLTPRSKVQTFNHFAENAFNYSILGELGFDVVCRLVDQCECFDFVYSRLQDALEVFDWIARTVDADARDATV